MTRGMRFRPLSVLASRRAPARSPAVCRPTARPGSPGVPVIGHVAPVRRTSSSRTTARTRRRASRTARRARRSSSSRRCSSTRATATWCAATSRSRSRSSRPAWFNFPDYGIVKPGNNNFAGIGACDSCGNGYPVQQRAQRRARADPAAAQLRRRSTRGRPTSPIRRCPSCGAAIPRPRRSTSTTSSPRATRRSGTTWGTATGPARRTTRPSCSHVYNEMLIVQRPARPVPARRPAVRRAHRGRAVPGGAAPAGPRDRGDADGRLLRAERRRQRARVQRRARARLTRRFDWDLARDIAVMPDGNGYVVLTGIGTVYKYGSAADPRSSARSGSRTRRERPVRGRSRSRPTAWATWCSSPTATSRSGGRAATGPLAALGSARRSTATRAQHRGDARRRRLPGARHARRCVEVRHRDAGLRRRRRARPTSASTSRATS